MASNVTSLTADAAASALNTTILSMNLNLNDAMMILNQFNAIQNNYRTSAEDLSASIGAVGAVANQAGISLDKLNGYTTALVSSTGIEGSEAGTALKSMISRTYRIGSEGVDDAGKTEILLNEMGVAVRDKLSGNFREFGAILQDVKSGWSSYSNIEKMAIAQSIGGTQHFSKFTSLMENFGIALSASKTALNSENSALIENSKALDSLSGKWKIFQAGMNNTKMSLLDDEVLSDLLDIGIALTGVTEKVGGFNIAMATLMTLTGKKIGMFDFITNAKDFGELFGSFKELGIGIKNSLKNAFDGLSKLGTGFKTAGMAAKATNGQVAATNITLKGTKIAASAAAMGLQLFKAAATFGLSLALSFIIEKLINFVSHLVNAKQELKEFNNQMMETSGDDTSNFLKTTDLKAKIDNTQSQIDNSTNKSEKLELEKQLVEYQKQMAQLLPSTADGYTKEGDAIAANTQAIQEQIDAKKQKMILDAQEFVKKNDNINATLTKINKEKSNNENIKSARANGQDYYTKKAKSTVSFGYSGVNKTVDIQSQVDASDAALEKSEEKMIEYRTQIAQTQQMMQNLRSVGIADDELVKIFGTTPEKIQQQIDGLKSYSEKMDEIRQKAFKEASAIDESPQAMGEKFNLAVQEAQKLRDIVSEINENGRMTPDIISQVAKSYPELTGKLHNATAIQDALNEKIKDQVAIQQEAYQVMIGDDASWYSARLQNANEMQGYFSQFASDLVGINLDAYNFDVKNYGTLNEAKAGLLNVLAKPMSEFLSKYVGGNAESYEKDLSNFNSLGQAKAYVLSQLNEKMKQLQANYESIMDSANDAIQKYNNIAAEANNKLKYSASNADSLRLESRTLSRLSYVKKNISEVSSAIGQASAAFDGFYKSLDVGVPDFSTPNVGSKGSSPATKAEKDAQDERVKMEEEANRQIQDLRDKLVSALKKKYDDLRKKELEPLDKEIEMKQKELERLQNGGKDEKERLAALKEELRLWEKNDSTYSKEKV